MVRSPARRAVCRGAGAAALLCCLPALRVQAERLRQEGLALVEVAPGIHVTQGAHAEATPANLGAIANTGFIVGDTGVAVVDTGGCLLWGRRLREAIAGVTDRPVRYVVQTHMHPDHVFGAAAFLADHPVFLGHARLAAALMARATLYQSHLDRALGSLAAGSRIVLPDRTVADELTLDLGDRLLRITAHPTAHTDNDLSLLDLRTGTLWAGDLLFMQRTPAIDGSLLGWLQVMESLRRLPARHVVPGHGPTSADWPAALTAQQRYLERLRDEIRGLIKAGVTIDRAAETVAADERGRWLLFDDYNPRNVTAAFAELEWE